MTFSSPLRPPRQVRVILSSPALLSFKSVWNAAALALAQLGIAAFFVSGVARLTLGAAAGWFVLAAAVLAALVRSVDIESWALFIPGGLVARVQYAFGPRAAKVAAAAGLVERLLLAALASVIVGHYAAGVVATTIAGWRLPGHIRPEDGATLLAAVLIGLLWIRARMGLDLSPRTLAKGVWIGVSILLLTIGWGLVSVIRGGTMSLPAPSAPRLPVAGVGWPLIDVGLAYLFGLAIALPTVGGGEALARAAHELPPPRIQALRRAGLLTVLFALLVTTLGTFLFALLVPADELSIWINAPLAGLAQHLAAPSWARDLIAFALVGAAGLILVPAAHAALGDTERTLRRLSAAGTLPGGLESLHARFGTPTRAIDLAVAATILVILISGGTVTWLARAYAIAIAATAVVKIASLVRLRRTRSGARPFKAPMNLRLAGRELPLGLLNTGLLLAAGAVVMIGSGDAPSIATVALLGGLVLLFAIMGREAESAISGEGDVFELLPSAELSLDQIEARPGNVLVPVRNPHSLAHVTAALQAAGDRDVVVMTVRLLGVDVSEDASRDSTPTPAERRLFEEVVAVAERHSHPVRLLIAPAPDVFEAVVATVLRLRSSEVYVGESSTLSAEQQARLLGDAWERAAKPESLDVRLVISPPRRWAPSRMRSRVPWCWPYSCRSSSPAAATPGRRRRRWSFGRWRWARWESMTGGG